MNSRHITMLLLCALVLSACDSQTAPGVPAADPPGIVVPLMSNVTHIPTIGSPHELYNSVPPTSGPHVPQTVATGIYREQIPQEVQVRVLELGHVIVQYAPGLSPDDVHSLERIGRSYPRDVVVAPYAKLPTGIAVTAWGYLLRLEQVDPAQIRAFIESRRSRYVHE